MVTYLYIMTHLLYFCKDVWIYVLVACIGVTVVVYSANDHQWLHNTNFTVIYVGNGMYSTPITCSIPSSNRRTLRESICSSLLGVNACSYNKFVHSH